MSDELWRLPCPVCGSELVYDRWGGPFRCGGCGARLEPRHECAHDAEALVEQCYDWLAVTVEVSDGE
jgi:hypothetical protein